MFAAFLTAERAGIYVAHRIGDSGGKAGYPGRRRLAPIYHAGCDIDYCPRGGQESGQKVKSFQEKT
ncbi:MAG: hypothetical protein AAF670_20045, partial [Planctomycetota bacterium]